MMSKKIIIHKTLTHPLPHSDRPGPLIPTIVLSAAITLEWMVKNALIAHILNKHKKSARRHDKNAKKNICFLHFQVGDFCENCFLQKKL